MTPQDIINAIISYFFLGPIIWLAKKNPNFSHPFIQSHARRSTFLFLLAGIFWIVFIFVIKPITRINIFSTLVLSDIILGILIVIFLGTLIWHAFRAYKGEYADEVHIRSFDTIGKTTISDSGILSEKEKVLTTLSFIPYLGIWIYKKFPSEMTRQGELLSSWVMTLILTTSIFFHTGYSFGLILTLFYIGLVVTLSVRLFLENTSTQISILNSIPSIGEINTLIISMSRYTIHLGKILIGKESSLTFSEIYKESLTENSISDPENYIISPRVIGIPLVNLITFPSFFMEKYNNWRFALLQGYIISFLVILYMFMSWNPLWIPLVLIPTIFLISELEMNPRASSPIVGILATILNTLSFNIILGKERIKVMKDTSEKLEFHYHETQEVDTNR